jgi:hypothetical protein
MLAAPYRVRRSCWLGMSSVCDRGGAAVPRDLRPEPRSPYGASKRSPPSTISYPRPSARRGDGCPALFQRVRTRTGPASNMPQSFLAPTVTEGRRPTINGRHDLPGLHVRRQCRFGEPLAAGQWGPPALTCSARSAATQPARSPEASAAGRPEGRSDLRTASPGDIEIRGRTSRLRDSVGLSGGCRSRGCGPSRGTGSRATALPQS